MKSLVEERGGLFEKEDSQQKTAFYRAISMINTDNNVIYDVHLVPRVENVAPQDSFRALKKSCGFLQEGVAAIFSPESPSNSAVLRSLSNAFQMPMLQTNWVPRSATESNSTINLFPDTKLLASAFVEFLKEHNWKSFTFIYEDNEDLIRLQDLLQMPTAFKDSQVKIFLRQAREGLDLNKMMKDLNKLGQTNFVMDLPLPRIKEVFAAGEKVDMMTEYNNYLITTLDVHTVEWTENYIGRPNITAFRLIDPENEVFKRILKDWIYAEQILGNEVIGKQPITTEAALMYDAFTMFSSSLHAYRLANSNVQVMSLDCDSSNFWKDGQSLANHMKFKNFEGASGMVKIDMSGARSSFSLDLVKVTKRGIIKVATWDTENGFTYKKEVNPLNEAKELLKNATLRVTTVMTKPYMMEVEDKTATGNDRFEGFCKDLLDKLTEALGFRYVIERVKDDQHGSFKTGEWNGMIGELLRREADLAIGDLSITAARDEAVDFTMPFMTLGISILFKKPERQNPPLFSFFQPLSIEVWGYMATAYLGVSLYLYILARVSPYEWVKPPKSVRTGIDVVENKFTLHNSFYSMMGFLMRRGCHFLPRLVWTSAN
ncbi:hypothetical protein JTE90_005102 [Oedothorax gibbosus]|uniref:Uncharacterized protein n=1 Tax=Oedothorax gibbosus TaxID=931172 RepID=A0AAV6V9N8_9ARAC|nr:hypothetical protein JTE90_005102 [Oedothorax gibbosus]